MIVSQSDSKMLFSTYFSEFLVYDFISAIHDDYRWSKTFSAKLHRNNNARKFTSQLEHLRRRPRGQQSRRLPDDNHEPQSPSSAFAPFSHFHPLHFYATRAQSLGRRLMPRWQLATTSTSSLTLELPLTRIFINDDADGVIRQDRVVLTNICLSA